jgi:hypothetical protein
MPVAKPYICNGLGFTVTVGRRNVGKMKVITRLTGVNRKGIYDQLNE